MSGGGARPLRVLHVLTTLGGFGGIQASVTNLLAHLHGREFDVELALGPGEGPHVQRLRERGIRIHPVPLVRSIRPWTDARALPALVRLMREGAYDVVHTHMSKGHLLGRAAARWAQVPLVVSSYYNFGVLHFPGSPVAPAFFLLDWFMARWFTDVVLSDSEGNRQEVIRRGMIAAEKIVTIHMAPDLPRFDAAPRAQGLAQIADLKAVGPVVGTVGRLIAVKALPLLIEAAALVLRDVPNARFVIVGDGPERRRLERLVHQHRLEGRIRLLGAAPADALIPNFDVFVLCSHSEGLPMSVMEAMVAGRPIVATRVGGVPELIADGESGLLVPPGDPRALAAALVAILRDPARQRRLGAAAREQFETRISLARTVAEVGDLYRSRLAMARGDDPVATSWNAR